MVTHTRLQYYKHNYCLLCITGSLGCRWHRYRQSARNSRKKDLIILVILLITFIYMAFYLYFWLVAENDSNDFNWYFTVKLKLKYLPWYTIMLSITGVVFGYLTILVGLSICHIYVGHQLYIHPFHVAMIIISLLSCIGFTIAMNTLWPSEWAMLKLSFQIVGPFIHVGLIVIFTILTWILIRQWYILDRFRLKLLTLVAYMAILVGLYVIPLFIESPCVRPADSLPSKPRLFAHRGASGVAPENTLVAFQLAANQSVYGFESDVRISSDGIPFILHDDTLRRTTNIEEVYPDRVDDDASTFTFAEMRKLNAGSWFLEEDPMDVVGSLTDKAKEIYNNQTIMSLKELIDLAHLTGKNILIDIRYPVKENRYNTTVNEKVVDVILNTGIPPKQIWWFSKVYNSVYTTNFTQTGTSYLPVEDLVKLHISNFNARYDALSEDEILQYLESNITTNVYLVNTYWLFSLYWCLGVQSVTTDECHVLNKIEKPLWHLTPGTYLMTWVSVDIISAIIIITILIVQWVRLLGTRFNPETISLHSQQTMTILTDQYHSNSRTMKEKLLFTADQLEEDVLETTEGVSNDHIDSPTHHYMNTAADTIVISVPQ
ncbi:glycerophosphodiester phosphodiesterase domain-containing protein 5 isoform X1 [Octopus bimaculoides]|uniref:glycerophosphodiester phosphodiesterase domain-containing protein 5 isoform X1 n=1 Tax=Octopus bimaculoides TaxID=37653 RepID=UPI0022DF9FA4|nr:glycerophosphodiester phosphodiesterase domain-containing protein 5 isoform X1 [Octopus bimaculoides]XP_052824134.1 glycerophosphodiester phosphodiesterase domain-containing protein 5 isoform X1 [Octopus bimaculoides]XP_052824135.1 glycerophosphodiester phosphodiesterase domain-containing protein 5 isoform X1 [Octopus bimaculoides]